VRPPLIFPIPQLSPNPKPKDIPRDLVFSLWIHRRPHPGMHPDATILKTIMEAPASLFAFK
jgi:hypothetical protein